MWKEESDSTCRLCKQHEESTDHLTSGCPILEKNDYLMRQDKVCTHLLYSACIAMTDRWYTHTNTLRPVYEQGDVTVWWNQAAHTDRDVTANRSDIIIKNKKEKTSILIDVAIPAERNIVQNSGEKTKVQDFMNRDTTNVEHKIYDYTGSNWNHRNNNKMFKEKFGSNTREIFNRLTTKDSYVWNITHNTERTAV